MFHNGHGLLCGAGEYCRMVDRDGKQVLLCTWSRRSPTLDFDFQFLEDPESAEKPQVRQVSDVVFNLRSTAVVLSGWITGQPQRSCRGKTQVLQSQSQSLIHYRWLTLFHVWREWWRDERSGFSDFTAASGLVGWLVSIPQSKSWSSPSVGWEGSMCKHFSGCGHAVMHVYTNAVLPTIVIHTNAVFTHHCRRYTCSVTHHCHTYTSTVIHTNAVLPATVIHTNVLLPTTVIHTHAVLPATHTYKCVVTHHCHTYTCSITRHCHTYKCVVTHHSHTYTCSITHHRHTCKCVVTHHCHTYTCTITHHCHSYTCTVTHHCHSYACTVTHHCHTYACTVTHHCHTYKCSVMHHCHTYRCIVTHHCHTYRCIVTHHCHTYKCRVTHHCHAYTSSVTHHCYTYKCSIMHHSSSCTPALGMLMGSRQCCIVLCHFPGGGQRLQERCLQECPRLHQASAPPSLLQTQTSIAKGQSHGCTLYLY